MTVQSYFYSGKLLRNRRTCWRRRLTSSGASRISKPRCQLCHDRLPIRMRQKTSLLILASLFGAATGATVAWQVSRSERTLAVAGDHPGLRAGSTARFPPHAPTSLLIPTIEQEPEIPAQAANERANPAGSTLSPIEPERASEPTSVASTAPLGTANASPTEDGVVSLAYSLVAWTAASDAKAAEQGCLSGEPTDCLRLADLADQRGGPSAPAKSRGFRDRAYSMLVLQCKRRDPDACVIIARMHALGFDVLRAPNSQKALVMHAGDLCKHRSAKVCSAFPH